LEQAEVDVPAALVTGPESLEGVQPGEAAFDDPALTAQAGAVGHAAAGDAWGDPAGAQLPAVDVVVVAAVSEQLPGSSAGPAAAPADRWDGLDQWDQLRDVVAVAAVRVTAGGMPPASQIRCCLEPGRPRSTGDGPT
jgi:hypothetical protein